MTKAELRKIYLEKRRNLIPEECRRLSATILSHFTSLDLTAINYLHIFYPIAGKSEFNTMIITDWLRVKHPEIKLVLSKSDLTTHSLSHYIWDKDTSLAMNQWGITEPENGAALDPELLDMVLVPLLAFDRSGNRVGYGKGFYDRFLLACRPDVQKIGISCFPPEKRIADVNEHDVALNKCITPEKIWEF